MSALRIALVVIAAALAGVLGWMTDWGQDFYETDAQAAAKVTAKADATSVLPDFKLSPESNAYAQIADRPLLNPTRKPAPTQALVAVAPEPPKPQIRRGLYQLVGIADYGSVKVAQVRELATRKVASVKVGDALQELTVRKVTADSVTLSFASEEDVISMAKYTPSGQIPAPTPQPMPVNPMPVAPSGMPQPIAAGVVGSPTAPPASSGMLAGLPANGNNPQNVQSSPPPDAAPPPRRSISMRERLGIGRDTK
jgi:hypothetical protein